MDYEPDHGFLANLIRWFCGDDEKPAKRGCVDGYDELENCEIDREREDPAQWE